MYPYVTYVSLRDVHSVSRRVVSRHGRNAARAEALPGGVAAYQGPLPGVGCAQRGMQVCHRGRPVMRVSVLVNAR